MTHYSPLHESTWAAFNSKNSIVSCYSVWGCIEIKFSLSWYAPLKSSNPKKPAIDLVFPILSVKIAITLISYQLFLTTFILFLSITF